MKQRCKSEWLGRTAAVLLAISATLAQGDGARADCSQPDFDLLWSYPEDGDGNVPINAQLWMLTSTWSSSTATFTLNGEPLSAAAQSFGGVVIDPGELEPNTHYTLELRIATDSVPSSEQQLARIQFVTESEAAPSVSAPNIGGHTTELGYVTHSCAQVVAAQDCFDTGQDTLLVVLSEDDDALGWVIEPESGGPSAVWPARCGDPSLYGYGDTLLHSCVLVRKIGPGGLLSERARYCPDTGATSDAGMPEPRDAGVPGGGGTGGGVVSPEDAGANGPRDAGVRNDNDMSGGGSAPPDPDSDDVGDEADLDRAADKDDGCSVGARLASDRGQGTTSRVSFLTLLAIALGWRTRRR